MKFMKEKEKKNKVPKTSGGKRNILPGACVLGLVIAIIIYAVMLNTEKNVLSDYARASVYVAVKDIPTGQPITSENFQEYFALKEIDEKIVPAAAFGSSDQLEGLVALYKIDSGSIITSGMFDTVNEITKDMENPVIAGFKADDLYQVVGGVLRAGDRIHIYRVVEDENAGNTVVTEADDGTDGENANNEKAAAAGAVLMWENIYVQDVFDQTGNRIISGDVETSAQRINVYLDKSDVEAFYAELASGTLRVVKDCK